LRYEHRFPFTPPRRKKSLLIAIDFDGTIVEHMFPEIGPMLPGAAVVMKRLQEAGHRLILTTCREDEPGRRNYLTEAVRYCEAHGIVFRSVNENHPDDEFRNVPGRKVYADIYIDDRNLGGFPGWYFVDDVIFNYYDPDFGDDLVCCCGHPYYWHFDTYNQMAPIGCKHCECRRFKKDPNVAEPVKHQVQNSEEVVVKEEDYTSKVIAIEPSIDQQKDCYFLGRYPGAIVYCVWTVLPDHLRMPHLYAANWFTEPQLRRLPVSETIELLFHNPVFKPELNITVRLGRKWLDFFESQTLPCVVPIRDTFTGEQHGYARLQSAAYLKFTDIPNEWLVNEHDPACRNLIGLYETMRKVYPNFKSDSMVTVLWFYCTSVGPAAK
jgi:hypothetical protein